MRVKYLTTFIRIISQYLIYESVKQQSDTFRSMCQAPPMNQITQNFMLRLVLLAYLPYMCQYYKKYFKKGMFYNFFWCARKLSARLVILFILKIFTFSNYDSFGWLELFGLAAIEILIINLALASDLLYFYATEAAELLIFDIFLLISYVLQLTRIFCPQYALFYLYCNLLVVCVSIVEGFALKIQNERIGSLYAKQDGYRMLMFTCLYMVMFVLGCYRNAKFNYALAVGLCLPLFIVGMGQYKQAKFKTALILIFLSSMVGVVGPRYIF